MFLHKNVGFFSQLPILYFQQVTVIPTITFYQNDPYLNYVVLNINGDTALSGNNNTFLDSGFRNISANGNVTQGTFSPFSPAGWSGYFNGSSYLTLPDDSAWDVGGNYTLEFWFNCTGDSALNGSSVRDACLIGQSVNSTSGWSIILRGNLNTTGTGISFTVNNPNVVLATMSISKNVWYHFALVTNGSTATIYVNGANVGSAAYTTTTNLNALLSIGRLLNISGYENYFIGYISNLRVIKGTALYTTNFTPNSAEPLKLLPNTSLLTLQDNRFKDNSRNNFTLSATGTPQIQPFSPIAPAVDYTPSLHGGSAYFDGNTSFLTNATNLNFSGVDWTIEAYVYTTVANGAAIIQSTTGTNNWIAYLSFAITSDLKIRCGINAVAYTSTQTIRLNEWTHLALIRSAGIVKLYINGIASSISQTSDINNSNLNFFIGKSDNYDPNSGGINYHNGYISNLRIVKGQAVYTSNFTPPSRLVTATSNGGASVGTTAIPNLSVTPSLLLDFDNGGIIDRSYKNDALVFGDSKTQTLSSKFGTGSLYFDGTGDYLTLPTNPNLSLGTGDFTIEFWMNPSANNGYRRIITSTSGLGTTNVLFIRFENNTKIAAYIGNAGIITSTTIPAINTWCHIALSRTSGTVRLFINGTSEGTNLLNNTISLDNILHIGGWYTTGNTEYYQGYIEDLRVTKGISRYTGTFTPPSKLQANNSDPYYSNVVLFLDGNNNGSNVNNEFRATAGDAARLAITRTSNVTQGSFSPFSPNGWSGYFTSSYLTVPNNTALSFGTTGDFTVEAWYYALTNGDQRIVGATTHSSSMFGCNPSIAFGRSNLGWDVVATGINFPLNTWSHVAYIRQGTNGYIYLNGIKIAGPTSISGYSYSLNGNLAIGTDVNSTNAITYYANGYISNLRIVKGLAVYTSNFTPPTGPLPSLSGSGFSTSLLTLQDNRFKDNSPNNFTLSVGSGTPTVQAFNPFKQSTAYSPTVHGGSGYFDGSSYLTSSGTNLTMGSNNWTIECWLYDTASTRTGIRALGAIGNATTGDIRFGLNVNKAYLDIYGIGSPTTAIIIPANTWTHVAFVRIGTTVRIYVNGILDGTPTTATNHTATNLTIGSIGTASYWNGYISNLRIVKGRALYTSNFTPPTSPVTAVNGTSLLLNFDNGYAIDSTGNNVITTVGDSRTDVLNTAPLSSSTGSLYFNGASHISVPINNNLQLKSSDFTIESWIYTISTSQQTIVGSMNAAGSSGSFSLYINNASGLIRFFIRSTSNVDYMVGTGTIPLNVWNHIAVTRQGSNLRIFLNGQQIGVTNTTLGANNITDTTSPIIIGSSTDNSVYFNGYIDDLRITKGVARYTSNFTPQTYENPTSNLLTYPTDPFRNLVVLDLNADTVNNEQNNTFLDRSGNNLTITRSGSTTQGSFSPFSPTGWSGLFNNTTSDYLSIPYNNAFSFGTGNFTIEVWVNFRSFSQTGGPQIVGLAQGANNTRSWYLYADANGVIGFIMYVNGLNALPLTSSITSTLNTWHHIAIVRSSGTTTMYINGVSVATTNTQSGSVYENTAAVLQIGREAAFNSGYFNGHISNLRIVKGQALYTNTFTPPTAALTTTSTVSGVTLSAENVSLLTLQDNRFKDNSNNNFTISVTGTPSVKPFSPFQPTATYSPTVHGGSGYFNGSIYLSITNNLTQFYISTGSSTIECYVYKTSISKNIIISQTQNNTSPYNGWLFYIDNRTLTFEGSNASYLTSNILINLNEWVHVAAVRVNNTVTLYINGIIAGSGTVNVTDHNGNLAIGSYSTTAGGYFNGYISNLRLTKGVAITPPVGGPTAPVQAVSGTSLLLNFDNAGVVDSTGKNDVTTYSTAKVDYANLKYGSGALKFNGTNDYMQVGTASDWTFLHSPSAKWTIEFWIYNNSSTGTVTLLDTSNSTTANAGLTIQKLANHTLQTFVYRAGSGTSAISGTSTPTLPLSTWTHVAITYDHSLASNNMVMYFNGLSSNVFTKSANAPATNNPANALSIGSYGNGAGSFLNGAIDELRITNAVRYTENFSVSSYTLPLSS